MSEDRLDRQIKSKLKHHETNMDVASFWDELSPKIQQNKKDRRGLIWFFFIPLFLGLIGLVYFNWDSSKPSTSMISSEKSDITLVRNAKEIIESSSSVGNDDSEKSFSSDQLNADQPEKKETRLDTSVEILDDKKETILNDIVTKEIRLKAVDKTRGNILTQPIDNINQTNKSFGLTNNSINYAKSSDPINEQTNTTIEIDNEISTSFDLKKPSNRSKFFYSPLDLSLRTLGSTRNDILNTHFMPELEKQGSDKSLWSYALASFVSYGQFNRNLEAGNDTLSNYLKLDRDQKETLLESLGGGLYFEISHKSGLFGTIGVNYNRLNERYTNYIISHEIQPRTNVITGIEITEDSVSNYFSDAKVLVTYSTEQIRYNSIHFVDIPMSIGYRKEFGNYDVSLAIGTQFNLMTRNRGTISNRTEVGYDLKTDEFNYFKKSSGLAWNGDLIFGYRLTSKYRLWTAYSYINRLSSLTNDNYGLNQFYQQQNIKLGLQINL